MSGVNKTKQNKKNDREKAMRPKIIFLKRSTKLIHLWLDSPRKKKEDLNC